MELTTALACRRSVRSYTSAPVDRALLERLIKTATLAPSGMNSQPWAFGVIEGVERLRLLSDRVRADVLSLITPGSPLERYRDELSKPEFNVFYGAPVLVVLYARPNAYDARGACAMAAYTLMLAAHEAGLGTCWIGFSEHLLNSAELQSELGVPAGYMAVAPLIVGYPATVTKATSRNEPDLLYWKSPV